MAAYLLWTIR